MSGRVVVAGAGHGGSQVCISLREQGWKGGILLFGEEPHAPYHRPPLSKAFLKTDAPDDSPLLRPLESYTQADVIFRPGARVTGVNAVEREIRTSTGEVVSYDTLVLATGATEQRPPIPGAEDPRALGLRTLEDARRIRGTAEQARSVLILGGGFIGLEVAASLRERGLAVTVLEREKRVMGRVVGEQMSSAFEALHREKGVSLRLEAQVERIDYEVDQVGVTLSTGEYMQADFLVVGAGARPRGDLAESAGLELDKGIVVDAYNRTSDPHIFAIGDCCAQIQPSLGRRLRLESVQNALDQARTVARAIAGDPVPHAAVPWFWSDQYDRKLQIVGLSAPGDQVIVRGEDPSFSVWYLREGQLRAVEAMNDARSYAGGTKLIALGAHPDPDALANPHVPLKTMLQQAKEGL